MKFYVLLAFVLLFSVSGKNAGENAWIRINLLGYQPNGTKVAVWCSKEKATIKSFFLVDASTNKVVLTTPAGKAFGAYGPFKQTYRLDFSTFRKEGRYYLESAGARSPVFTIGENVYDGAADFCLRYMRQQRSGFNPFLKDSCHTQDGYTVYGPMKDSTHVDVSGGWHDASDYLQYATTSANATYHLLMAYRDFPDVFKDVKAANGLDGKNGTADVLDEAKWGLDWLLKMHPRPDWMFNQIADDRDHISMRIPKMDSQYNKGYERPVYFINGEPQGLFQYKNRTKGTSSTAAKFSSAFALGSTLFLKNQPSYSDTLFQKSLTAMQFAKLSYGVTQTAPGRAPYFYEEDNWTDDMELAYAQSFSSFQAKGMQVSSQRELLDSAYQYAKRETVTPWLGKDTAKHYQWYPFINLGHYELAKQLLGKRKDSITGFYKKGITAVWNKAKQNGFYRGVPFIWCSNNLTVSFAIQCYWYRVMTGNRDFEKLEQANFDWIFGCNPWGTSMVYGLPAGGDTPIDPHSAFTHLGNYPIDGGLVDGPVKGSIFNNLKGIRLYNSDAYADFQSDLAVYHDDYGDYSTNEPTMDGTASLIYLLAAKEGSKRNRDTSRQILQNTRAVVRGDTTRHALAIVFTGHEFGEGGKFIHDVLQKEKVKASFFLTGDFYRNAAFKENINNLARHGHYMGAHSDKHLLYADWSKRDSLLVSRKQFSEDLLQNYSEMKRFGIPRSSASFFLPPYEWYNDSIAFWTREMGLQLINYTPGTLSHADYTLPGQNNYRSSEAILQSITDYEQSNRSGLNGFILLMHIGAGPQRTDKFYEKLPQLIGYLKSRGYELVRVDELLR